jgi:vacuolar-type H+-ATPase subunit E/Vma4
LARARRRRRRRQAARQALDNVIDPAVAKRNQMAATGELGPLRKKLKELLSEGVRALVAFKWAWY